MPMIFSSLLAEETSKRALVVARKEYSAKSLNKNIELWPVYCQYIRKTKSSFSSLGHSSCREGLLLGEITGSCLQISSGPSHVNNMTKNQVNQEKKHYFYSISSVLHQALWFTYREVYCRIKEIDFWNRHYCAS